MEFARSAQLGFCMLRATCGAEAIAKSLANFTCSCSCACKLCWVPRSKQLKQLERKFSQEPKSPEVAVAAWMVATAKSDTGIRANNYR